MAQETEWIIDAEALRRWQEEGERLKQEADELIGGWREHFNWVTDFFERRVPSAAAGHVPVIDWSPEEKDELDEHAAEMERLVTLMVQKTVEAAVHSAHFPRPKPRPR
ncbi:MAG: hypothetical protein ACUVV3_08985 [Dehalococcoidia bacterium]